VTKEAQMLLIPYLKGQGLNNQIWEYRTAAIIARATGRTLCLEPFHKFYLQQSGREFLPFEELFDVHFFNKYVNSSIGHECSKACDQKLHSFIELTYTSTNSKINPFSIPEWRPGSLNKFQRSTGFVKVPIPKGLNINPRKGGVPFDSLSNIKTGFQEVAHGKCVAVSGPLLELEHEFILWTKFLRANKAILELKDFIVSNFYSGSSYLAIHWRLEETKCAGVGVGIGYGRDAKERYAKVGSNKPFKIIRKSDNRANLCFYGVIPSSSPTRIWFRLISKEAIVKWTKRIMSTHGIENLYLATDLKDSSLLNWIKSEIPVTTKKDIEGFLEKRDFSSDNDVLSILEQEICAEADIFAGTQMSSWTERVIEKRFMNQGHIFKRDKSDLLSHPDPSNRTLYFDVEVCACELYGE
tara:strand:+ start:3449 stop:4681 length:1233 start_codon:yes stop_codon:yes gene_type:complete